VITLLQLFGPKIRTLIPPFAMNKDGVILHNSLLVTNTSTMVAAKKQKSTVSFGLVFLLVFLSATAFL
jgi:hypothetical protein